MNAGGSHRTPRKNGDYETLADSKHGSRRLREFEAITPGIVGVETPDACEGVVPNTADTRVFQDSEQRVDIIYGERGMRLCGGAKSFFDANVKLGRAKLEPAATTRAQRLRLFDLVQLEQAAKEVARLRLASFGGCKLNVVDV